MQSFLTDLAHRAHTCARRCAMALSPLAALSVMTLAANPAAGQSNTTVVAASGQTVPDGVGVFFGFTAPVINEQGEIAFLAALDDTGSAGTRAIYRGGSMATLVTIARVGQAAPTGGIFADFEPASVALNDIGQVLLFASLTGSGVTPANDNGIYRGGGTLTTQIAREGQAPLGSAATFSELFRGTLNNGGQAAFFASLDGATPATDSGIYRGDGTTAPVTIVREGTTSSPGPAFAGFNAPSLNSAGQTAFRAALSGVGVTPANDFAIFRADGATTPVQIVREGQAAPGGVGAFSFLGTGFVNDAAQVTFGADLTGAGVTPANDRGIFRGSGGAVQQIVREGQTTPSGTVAAIVDSASSNAGDTVFAADLTGPGVSSANNRAIFRGDGATPLQQIAREGQAAPGGPGTFAEFFRLTVNDTGQVAFQADLSIGGGPADDTGIFLFDDALGLLSVARTGDPLLGSTIDGLLLASDPLVGDEGSGLNNLGQVAYLFTLANGGRGVAIYTIPEPASLSLLGLAGLALARRPRR